MAIHKVYFRAKPRYFDRTITLLLVLCILLMARSNGGCGPKCDAEWKELMRILTNNNNLHESSTGISSSRGEEIPKSTWAPQLLWSAWTSKNKDTSSSSSLHSASGSPSSSSSSVLSSAMQSVRRSTGGKPPSDNGPGWKNDNNIVHVLSTRFMQHQGEIKHLGKARMELFKTFTLPSILAQTTQQFLWCIFTDPGLQNDLLDELITLVKPHKNIIVIGKNEIWRDFVYKDWINKIDTIFSGDIDKLAAYRDAAKDHVFVETRLDADDALGVTIMENIQNQAARTLGVQAKIHNYDPNSFDPKQYKILCTEHHLEWGYFNPWDKHSNKGHLFGMYKKDLCITAGLTYIYQVGTRTDDLPTRAHNKIHKEYPACDNKEHKINCVERIDAGDLKYIMLRSRTPTSAAMQGVIPTKTVTNSVEWKHKQDETWQKVIEKNFAIKPESIYKLRSNFKANMRNILNDALKGQCAKKEFTCKESASEDLNKLLAEVSSLS